MYLKESYLQHQQCQEKQNTEQMIRDIAQRYGCSRERKFLLSFGVLGTEELGSVQGWLLKVFQPALSLQG